MTIQQIDENNWGLVFAYLSKTYYISMESAFCAEEVLPFRCRLENREDSGPDEAGEGNARTADAALIEACDNFGISVIKMP